MCFEATQYLTFIPRKRKQLNEAKERKQKLNDFLDPFIESIEEEGFGLDEIIKNLTSRLKKRKKSPIQT
jgi:DNA-binding transcriptional regulator YhcF (GntR family)